MFSAAFERFHLKRPILQHECIDLETRGQMNDVEARIAVHRLANALERDVIILTESRSELRFTTGKWRHGNIGVVGLPRHAI